MWCDWTKSASAVNGSKRLDNQTGMALVHGKRLGDDGIICKLEGQGDVFFLLRDMDCGFSVVPRFD